MGGLTKLLDLRTLSMGCIWELETSRWSVYLMARRHEKHLKKHGNEGMMHLDCVVHMFSDVIANQCMDGIGQQRRSSTE